MNAVALQRWLCGAAAAVVAAALACSPTTSAPGDSGPATPAHSKRNDAGAAAPRSPDGRQPLVPQKTLAQGVALPVGFERVKGVPGTFSYVGTAPAEDVRAFYHKYLDCSYVIEHKNGWSFEKATPVPPGDSSRSVDVVVSKRSRTKTQIQIADHTADRFNPKAPPATQEDREAFDRLKAAGHGGQGSVSQPIPGTY